MKDKKHNEKVSLSDREAYLILLDTNIIQMTVQNEFVKYKTRHKLGKSDFISYVIEKGYDIKNHLILNEKLNDNNPHIIEQINIVKYRYKDILELKTNGEFLHKLYFELKQKAYQEKLNYLDIKKIFNAGTQLGYISQSTDFMDFNYSLKKDKGVLFGDYDLSEVINYLRKNNLLTTEIEEDISNLFLTKEQALQYVFRHFGVMVSQQREEFNKRQLLYNLIQSVKSKKEEELNKFNKQEIRANTIYQHKNVSATTRDIQMTYLMIDGYGYIKIGKSKNPIARHKTLMSDNHTIELLAIKKFDIEKLLHHKYSKYRKNGEWFDFPIGMLDEIIEKYDFETVE